MISPYVLAAVLAFAGLYYVGEKAVEGIKKVDVVVAREAARTGRGLLHVITFGKK